MKERASESELRELFSWDEDEELPDVIRTCAGEWRMGAKCWYFYAYADEDQ